MPQKILAESLRNRKNSSLRVTATARDWSSVFNSGTKQKLGETLYHPCVRTFHYCLNFVIFMDKIKIRFSKIVFLLLALTKNCNEKSHFSLFALLRLKL